MSINDFWKLTLQSRLLDSQQCRQLHVKYQHASVGSDANRPEALAQWLVAEKHLTRYQAKILLAGKAGPFVYGEYTVQERLTQGPLQGCYRAQHGPTGHPVLLQFLSGDAVKDPQNWAAHAASISTLAALNSPRLHRWYEGVDLGSYKFLAAEQLEGRSLAEMLEGKRLKPQRACWIALQIAEGLAQLHESGFVHSDVRPDYIWMSPGGEAKLLLQPVLPATRSADDDTTVQADYAAPERVQMGPHVGSDVYALGCTLYQMLSGRPPFHGGDAASKMQRHAAQAIQSLETLRVPADVMQVVTYMMAKNPALRHSSMADVAAQLQPLAGDEAHLAPPSVASTTLESYLAGLPAPGMMHDTSGNNGSPPLAQPPAAIPATPVATAVAAAAPQAPAIAVPVPAAPAVPAATTAATSPAPVMTTAPRAPIQIQATSRHRSPARRSISTYIVLLICGLVLGGAVWFGWKSLTGPDSTAEQPEKEGQQSGASSSSQSGSGTDSTSGSGDLVMDDGKTLWASPTSGERLSLLNVPADSLLLIAVRPADVMGHSEGEKLLRALGPVVEQLPNRWQSASGIPFADLKQLLISVQESGDQGPRVALVAHLNAAMSRQQLLDQWGQPETVSAGDGTYYKGAEWAYYLPGEAGETVQTVVLGIEEDIKSVAERGGAPPPLHPGLEPLLRVSDEQRMLNVLFVPQFLRSTLLRDGREFYFGDAQRLREPVEWLLGDGVRGGMFSAHLDSSHFYLELTLANDITRDRYQLADDMRQRMRNMPRQMVDYLATNLNPPSYWRKVALQVPMMMQFVGDHTRIDVDRQVVVMNAALPTVSAHNLAFVSEVMLASQPLDVPTGPTKPMPPTLDALLAEKINIRYQATTFEFALRDLSQDIRDTYPRLSFPFEIKLLLSDLGKRGITQNQTIADFQVEDGTIAEVLTKLVMRCNPVTTVTSPSDAEQVLIWVVGPDPDNASQSIVLITTRDAAAEKNYELPAMFKTAP